MIKISYLIVILKKKCTTMVEVYDLELLLYRSKTAQNIVNRIIVIQTLMNYIIVIRTLLLNSS